MSLLLGQLVYTSFAGVGFKTLNSPEVPAEIQQAFIEQVVYQYWDFCNPPSSDYRAVYLHQLTPEDSLFGWLYNDGLDDFGRSDVPYFVCYYFAGLLEPLHLENIFTCLHNGPVELVDRQSPAVAVENLVAPDLWSYQSVRPGVQIPLAVRKRTYAALQQGKLLNLFEAIALEDTLLEEAAQAPAIIPTGYLSTPVPEELSTAIYSAQDDHQMLLAKEIDEQQGNEIWSRNREVWETGRLAEFSTDIPASGLSFIPNLWRRLTSPIASNLQHLSKEKSESPQQKNFPSQETEKQWGRLSNSNSSTNKSFTGNLPPQVPLTPSLKSPLISPQRLTWMLGIIGIVSSLTAVILGIYVFRVSPLTSVVQQPASSISTTKIATKRENLTLSKTLTGHADSIWSVALSNDGQTLISGSADKTIKVWNVDDGQPLFTLTGHTDVVRAIALSYDGQTIASGSDDGTIKLWNVENQELIKTLAVSSPVWSVVISRDGQTLVSGSEDGSIKIWNVSAGRLLRVIKGHVGRVFSVAISPDGEIFATGGLDKTIKFWNLRTGEQLRTIAAHEDAVRSVVFSRDGEKLASGSWDNTIKIWNRHSGELIYNLVGHASKVVSVTFSPDGKTLASGSIDNTVKIWSMQTGKLLSTLSGHSDWVLAVATSPSRQILVSSSKDKTIRIWQPVE
ncbi:MAG: WD40 repeat domain-containing protein [Heteroscytonema crispum UTEX LB 1556]